MNQLKIIIVIITVVLQLHFAYDLLIIRNRLVFVSYKITLPVTQCALATGKLNHKDVY
jgi:hypothetical protein